MIKILVRLTKKKSRQKSSISRMKQYITTDPASIKSIVREHKHYVYKFNNIEIMNELYKIFMLPNSTETKCII